jgi:hypothetical protein
MAAPAFSSVAPAITATASQVWSIAFMRMRVLIFQPDIFRQPMAAVGEMGDYPRART